MPFFDRFSVYSCACQKILPFHPLPPLNSLGKASTSCLRHHHYPMKLKNSITRKE